MKLRFAVTAAIVVAVTLLAILPAAASPDITVQWLKSQQHADGGFGAKGSTITETAEVIYALAAARQDVAGLKANGKSPLDYLAANLAEAKTVGVLAKVSMAVSASGQDAASFGGKNLVGAIESSLNSEGAYTLGPEDNLISQTYAMLALAGAGRTVPTSAVNWLRSKQQVGGGWAWNASDKAEDADSNSTALALEALIAAGVPKTDEAIVKGVEYLRKLQNDDGGFPYAKPSPYGTDTDADSTAFCIQALIATGQDLAAWKTSSGKNPLDALASLQRNDGAFAWQASVMDANLLASAQAVPALLGVPYPIAVTKASAAVAATVAPAAEATGTAVATVASTAVATPAAQVLPVTGASGGAGPVVFVLAGLGCIAGGLALRRGLALR